MKVKLHAGPLQNQALLLAEHFYIQQHNSISISSLKTL